MDHYSRRVLGTADFRSEPSALDVVRFLRRTCRRSKCRPKHLITDHGAQFTADEFTAWCRHRGIQQRFGAIGKYGSLAVVERFIRSMKAECARLILVPLLTAAFQRELDEYVAWFNADRPHEFLAGATPDEVYFRRMPACRKPRFEPRAAWPRPSPCARPQALVRGRPGAEVQIHVEHREGRKHLPVVSLRRVA